MKKLLAAALACVLTLGLAACGGEEKSPAGSQQKAQSGASSPLSSPESALESAAEDAPEGEAAPESGGEAPAADGQGLLTQDEIATLESLYFAEDEKLEQAIPQADLDNVVLGMLMLKEKRTIAGWDCWVNLHFSETDPKGLYGVRLSAGIPDSELARETLREIYAQAVELYGEPNTYEGRADSVRLSEQPEDLTSAYETWSLGEKTDLTLTYRGITGDSDPDDMDLIELFYQVRVLKDGQPVDPVTQEPKDE